MCPPYAVRVRDVLSNFCLNFVYEMYCDINVLLTVGLHMKKNMYKSTGFEDTSVSKVPLPYIFPRKLNTVKAYFGNNIYYLLDTYLIPDSVEDASHNLFQGEP